MASLLARMKELWGADLSADAPLTIMGKYVLDWGKYKNDTFEKALEDKSYVKWCAGHLKHDLTNNQQVWMKYLERSVEKMIEVKGVQAKGVPRTTVSSRAKSSTGSDDGKNTRVDQLAETLAELTRVSHAMKADLGAMQAELNRCRSRICLMENAFDEVHFEAIEQGRQLMQVQEKLQQHFQSNEF